MLRDTLDPTAGFNLKDENGNIDPLKTQAVLEVNKSMNLGRYSPQMISAVFDSFRKIDEGGSEQMLDQVNFLSESNFQSAYNEFVNKNPNLPPETLAKAKEGCERLLCLRVV